MSNVYIPDARMTMPELFYPGRKPVGLVNIDWDGLHKLGISKDNLTIIFGNGNHKSLSGVDTIPFGGAGFSSDGGYAFTGVSGEYVSSSAVAPYASSTTVSAVIVFTYRGDDGPLFGKWSNSNTADKFFIGIKVGKVGIIFHNGSNYDGKVAATALEIGLTYTFSVLWNAGVYTFYLNGVEQAQEVWSGGPVTVLTSSTSGTFRIGGKEDSPLSTSSVIALILVSPNIVSGDALQKLSCDPYQLLVPA